MRMDQPANRISQILLLARSLLGRFNSLVEVVRVFIFFQPGNHLRGRRFLLFKRPMNFNNKLQYGVDYSRYFFEPNCLILLTLILSFQIRK